MCKNAGTPFLLMGLVTVIVALASIGIQAAATYLCMHGQYPNYHFSTLYVTVVTDISAGVWCGAVFLLTGIVSIVLGIKLHRHPLASYTEYNGLFAGLLVLSITSVLFCIAQAVLNGFTIEIYNDNCNEKFGLGIALIVLAAVQFAISVAFITECGHRLCGPHHSVPAVDGRPVAYVVQKNGGSHLGVKTKTNSEHHGNGAPVYMDQVVVEPEYTAKVGMDLPPRKSSLIDWPRRFSIAKPAANLPTSV